MYVGIVIPSQNGMPITTEAVMLSQIQAAQNFFDTQCNINLIYTGACTPKVDARAAALNVACNASGFFADWWLNGSYYEFLSSFCKFEDGWRRVLGYGAEILVIAVNNVRPDTAARTTVGCSFGPTYNYVVVEPGSGPMVTAHEIGHACNLLHRSNPNNLMTGGPIPTNPTITNAQIAIIRWSKHCVFF